MLPDNIRRVIICGTKVDFRKQWNGLLAESKKRGYDPYDGDLLLYVRRDKSQVRAICGDSKGLFLFSRRFEGGSIPFTFSDSNQKISLNELRLWFAGSRFTIHSQVKPWK